MAKYTRSESFVSLDVMSGMGAAYIAGEIESVPGLEDLFNGVTGDIPSIRISLDPVRVSRLGFTPADAAAPRPGVGPRCPRAIPRSTPARR